MFKTSLLLVFAAVALSQDAGREVISGSARLRSGVGVRYKALLSPANASLGSFGAGGVAVGGGNTLHRSMVDSSRGAYFGYDLVIEAGDSAGNYVATFQPLSTPPPVGASKPLLLPKYPAPQVVRDGDIIALDLLVSADGKQRLTDYIEIIGRVSEPPTATTDAKPRDFTLDDGPVKVDPSSWAVFVNGQKYQGQAGFTGKPGATFWIAIPGQGRYILSLTPKEGFVKSGVIRSNVISFEAGGQHYELRFMSPIAGANKSWNLYLLHDQAYNQPVGRLSAGVDRLENLLPQRP